MSQQRDVVDRAIDELEQALKDFWEETLDGITTGNREARHIAEAIKWMVEGADNQLRRDLVLFKKKLGLQ